MKVFDSGRTDSWYRKLPTDKRGIAGITRFYLGAKAVESSAEMGRLKCGTLKALVRTSSQSREDTGDTGMQKSTGERSRVGRDRIQISLQALEDPA